MKTKDFFFFLEYGIKYAKVIKRFSGGEVQSSSEVRLRTAAVSETESRGGGRADGDEVLLLGTYFIWC